MEERLDSLPAFSRVVELVGASNPLQRKRIRTMLRERDDTYFAFAEDVSRSLAAAFMRTPADALSHTTSVLERNVSRGFETRGFPGMFFLGLGAPQVAHRDGISG